MRRHARRSRRHPTCRCRQTVGSVTGSATASCQASPRRSPSESCRSRPRPPSCQRPSVPFPLATRRRGVAKLTEERAHGAVLVTHDFLPRTSLPLPHLLITQARVDDDLKLLALGQPARGIVTLRLRATRDEFDLDVLQQRHPAQDLGATAPAEIGRTSAYGKLGGTSL